MCVRSTQARGARSLSRSCMCPLERNVLAFGTYARQPVHHCRKGFHLPPSQKLGLQVCFPIGDLKHSRNELEHVGDVDKFVQKRSARLDPPRPTRHSTSTCCFVAVEMLWRERDATMSLPCGGRGSLCVGSCKKEFLSASHASS